MKISTKLKISVGAVALAAVTATSAQALTDTFNVSVAFTEPFTITETTPGNLGELMAGANGSYEQVATTGVVTPITPGTGVVNNALESEAVITLVDTGEATADVDITVGNQQAGANGYITITAFDCDYNGAALAGATCAYDAAANPAAGTALSIGFDILVAGSPPDASTDTADYDVTILFD